MLFSPDIGHKKRSSLVLVKHTRQQYFGPIYKALMRYPISVRSNVMAEHTHVKCIRLTNDHTLEVQQSLNDRLT